MFDLYIGDTTEYLGIYAQKMDSAAQLITQENFESFLKSPASSGYTSLGDFTNLIDFVNLCFSAKSIVYYPPAQWSDVNYSPNTHLSKWGLQQWTEYFIGHLSQTVPTTKLSIPSKYQFLQDSLLLDQRRSDKKQIWTAGCSVTHGVGVEKHQTFGHIIHQQTGLPISDLSISGASIPFAADQILRSELKSGDIVLWGITSWNRYSYALNNTVHRIHASSDTSKISSDLDQQFRFIDELDSVNTIYHDLIAIRQVHNVCQLLGVKLLMIGVILDFENHHRLVNYKNFRQSLVWTGRHYVDLGTDNLHPGPKQHRLFAKEFLEFHREVYGEDLVAKDQ
jgi:hypothetical protein